MIKFNCTEIKNILSEKFDKNKEEIIEVLSNEDNQIVGSIYLSHDDGEIYTFWHNGNTVCSDIYIKSVRGNPYDHCCEDCPLCEENCDRISENIGEDIEDLSVSKLSKIDKTFENHYFSEEEIGKTVFELRRECFIDNYYNQYWEDIKEDLIIELLSWNELDIEKIYGVD